MKKRQSDGRWVAAEVLHRVARDDAYASTVLDSVVRKAQLDSREAALATQISYGALRVLPTVDAHIRSSLHRPDRPVEPWAMAVMRCATFELMHMRSAPHAVVHRAVELAKSQRGAKLGAFVNGVLRKVAKARPVEPELPNRVQLPAWLYQQLASDLSELELEAFLGRVLPPPTSVATFSEADRALIRAELERRGAVDITVLDRLPSAVTFREGGDLRDVPESLRGRFRVMELGSQIVANTVPIKPGMRVADCCAGRGGKTLLLAARAGSTGEVHAFEHYESKLKQLPQSVAKLVPEVSERLAPITTHTVDLSVGTGGAVDEFDVAFVDLPCSGTGTLHRRPELMLRLSPSRVEALASLQEKICLHSAGLLRPGGVLVVAVCSLLAAEGPELQRKLVRSLGQFEPYGLTSDNEASEDVIRLGPWRQNADGFQMFALRRSA